MDARFTQSFCCCFSIKYQPFFIIFLIKKNSKIFCCINKRSTTTNLDINIYITLFFFFYTPMVLWSLICPTMNTKSLCGHYCIFYINMNFFNNILIDISLFSDIRRYGLLCRPSFSSCGGLQIFANAFSALWEFFFGYDVCAIFNNIFVKKILLC